MSLTQKRRAHMIAESYKRWGILGKKVLDAGCGNGVVSAVLKKELRLDLHGTDIIDYRKVDIPFAKMGEHAKLPFGDLSFDCVMLNDVLHHANDVEPFLLEAARVAPVVLIFEDKPGFLLRVVDPILNYFYSPQMPPPRNFKTKEAWCALFDKLGFRYEIGRVFYPFWYPFRHIAFKVEKK